MDNQQTYGVSIRIIGQKTHKYLRGVVGDNWIDLAIALKTSADCIPIKSAANDNMNAVYLMLMGYALEDLAKYIIASKAYKPEITDVTPFEEKIEKLTFIQMNGNKRKITIHDLGDLYSAEDIGFEVSPTEIDHLKVISSYTDWKGRYPVPLYIGKMPDPSSSEPNFEDLAKTVKSVYESAMVEAQKIKASHQ